MTPNNTTAQKQRVIDIFNALLRKGIIRLNQDFFKPIGVSAPLGSNILNPNHQAKFPKSKIQNLFDFWKVNPDFYWYTQGPMFLGEEYNLNGSEGNGNNHVTESAETNYKIASSSNRLKPITGVGTRREDSLRAIDRNIIPIPIVEKRAQAGYSLGHADPEYLEHLPRIYVTKPFEKGNYLAWEVEGDSMDDDTRRSICDGDVVLSKEVERDLWRDKLNFNKYLFVVVYNDGCVIKQITNHDTETGDLTCHSFNPFYNDFTINLKDVYQLCYVYKVVDKIIRL